MNQNITYRVVEKFVSINGEGTNAGKLAAFVRFAGCNLCCGYCDTKWANAADVPYQEMTAEQIKDYVDSKQVRFVTLTGGEPLLQEGMQQLVEQLLTIPMLTIEFETNGSIDLREMHQFRVNTDCTDRVIFTMDYKLPQSGMEEHMKVFNFDCLGAKDTVKFVSGSKKDLDRMMQVVRQYQLGGKCHLYVSPVFGSIEASQIVDYMMEHKLNDVTMQLQMHKFIWNPDQRGV